jgi:hypothetical protein
MDDVASYLQRGRKLVGLTLDELKSRSKVELARLVDDHQAGTKTKWEGISDVLAEFELRGFADIPEGAGKELARKLGVLQIEEYALTYGEDSADFVQQMKALDDYLEGFDQRNKNKKN